jgi:L-amino acid N-acyltransferase YncA
MIQRTLTELPLRRKNIWKELGKSAGKFCSHFPRWAVRGNNIMKIAQLLKQHYPAVVEIYKQGIQTGNATFQSDVPSWEEWDKNHLAHSRIVALEDDGVVGWAALTPISGRCVYAGVAEVSVYVADGYKGKGIGKQLLRTLIVESEKNNIWTLQAGIFPENGSSVAIHEASGFRKVGYRERIGQMQGQWRDTILLERRSPVVGVS